MPIAPPVERVAPQKIQPQIAPPLEAPVPRPAPVEAGTSSERPAPLIERATPPAIAPGSTALPPARSDVPGEQGPRLRFGAPDAGDEIFKPRSDVAGPATEPSDASRPDLEATRQRAREIATSPGYRGVAPVIPPPPPVERKSKLANAIEKAAKPDCRDAYAGMGLLAVVPLTVATIGNGGCRW